MDNKTIWNANWKALAEYSTNSAGNRWAFFLIRKVLKGIKLSGGTVLDVGCGMGNKSAVLAGIFPDNKVVGVDFSEEGISFASNYYSDFSNLSFICEDAVKYANQTQQNIELVSAFELIEHIEDWESFLHDLCNISNEYVLLSTPTGRMREYEKGIGHYRNNKKGEIEAFMKKEGYEPVSILYAGFPFWSPITRDFYNRINMRKKPSADKEPEVMEVSYNKLFHKVTYFAYRYLSFTKVGDQFMGLFRKVR